jgi:adenosine deaminase
VRSLPKAHLHLHLDGSFPRPAVAALFGRRGLPFAPPEHFPHVDDFFAAYVTVPDMVADLEELARLCRALVVAESRQGVVYLEPAVEPQLYAPRLGTMDDVLAVICAAFTSAAIDCDVEVGAMVTINTDGGTAGSLEMAHLAASYAGRGVVAFGTAGFIEPAGLARFAEPVAVARAAGLDVVCHAGQPGGPASVIDALDNLHPDRIAHGINAARDPALLRRLAGEGVVCDVCPTSNVALGVVADLASHPLPLLVAAGVAVTLNADDELWFGSSISDQYDLARTTFGLDDATIARIALTGGRAGGMSQAMRERLERGVAAWLAEPRSITSSAGGP